MSIYFDCDDPEERRTLVPLADWAFDELMAFGTMLAGSPAANKLNNAPLYLDRAAELAGLVGALSQLAHLRFVPGLPFVYSSEDDVPQLVAGYTDGGSSPAPKDVAMSLTRAWLDASLTGRSYPAPALLATLAERAASHGIHDATALLLDLGQSGQVIYDSDTAYAIPIMLSEQHRIADEGGEKGQIPQAGAVDNAALDPETLIRRASKEIAKVRAADSWDAWLVGQHRLAFVLPWCYLLLRSQAMMLHRPLPLVVETALSQYEEIAEDAKSFTFAVNSSEGDFDAQTVLCARKLAHEATLSNAAARDRLAKQRLLWPRALEQYAENDFAGMPRPWRHTSWRLIHAAVAMKGLAGNALLESPWTAAVDADHIEGESGTRLAREVMELNRRKAYKQAEAAARERLEAYPWSPSLRWELAIAYDGRGVPDLALQPMSEALHLHPLSSPKWHSMEVILRNLSCPNAAHVADRLSEAAARLG